VCTRCQRVQDIDEAVLASMIKGVRERHGFAVDHARLDVYGECAACRRTVAG
jgi:Fe2+ or Zn2+ uptake regulation protein